MPRPATGSVVERDGARGTTFGLRFRAHGKRQYVTSTAATRVEAEQELRHIMADVERGKWQPAQHEPAKPPAEEPTFHEFASRWLAARRARASRRRRSPT